MGAIFAYSFQLIAKICSITFSATFREVWEDTMGFRGGLAVSIVNMLKPALGNLAYSMILADTFRSLFATFFGWTITRNLSLLSITLVGILPLCLMKNLDALAPFSILGTFGIFLTATCMAIRYFDGSYDHERDGRFLNDLSEDLKPLFGDYNGAWTGDVLVFCAMIFEAFVAHYNAPRFMAELKDANMTRFRIVVANAFGFSSAVYVLMTAFGFLTFGGNCDGYILNNYSTNDHLATTCRVAIAFSILFTYPITFMGFRDGVLDIIELPQPQQTSTNINIITIFLLIVITILAAFVTDLGFINAVGGGTLATAIVFIFPAVMYRAAVDAQVHPPSRFQRLEVRFAMGLMVLGVLMGAVGVVVELQAT
jgi:amino acid permease